LKALCTTRRRDPPGWRLKQPIGSPLSSARRGGGIAIIAPMMEFR